MCFLTVTKTAIFKFSDVAFQVNASDIDGQFLKKDSRTNSLVKSAITWTKLFFASCL